MICIYYVQESSPYHMYVLDVEDDDFQTVLAAIEKEDYPIHANTEYIFLENDKVVNQYCI